MGRTSILKNRREKQDKRGSEAEKLIQWKNGEESYSLFNSRLLAVTNDNNFSL